MGQLKITDMFSSQPTTPNSKARAQLKITDMFSPQPRTPTGIRRVERARFSSRTQSEPRPAMARPFMGSIAKTSFSAQSTPMKPTTGRLEVHIAAKSPLSQDFATPPVSSASVPATPEGSRSKSPKKRPIAVDDSEEETVPETPRPLSSTSNSHPPKKTPPASSSRQRIDKARTPSKAVLATQGTSPFDAIDISSGIDSECEITSIGPSPKKKRKVLAARSRKRSTNPTTPTKRSKVPARLATNQTSPKPVASSVSKKRLVKGGSTVKPRVLQPIETVEQPADPDPDCFIEKVQPLSRTRLPVPSQQPLIKRKPVVAEPKSAATPMSVPVTIDAADKDHPQAPKAEIMRVTPSQKTQAKNSAHICIDSDADSETSGEEDTPSRRGATTPQNRRKSFSSKPLPRRRLFVKMETTSTPSTTSQRSIEKSPVIDLTECPLSDSEASMDEFFDSKPHISTGHHHGNGPLVSHGAQLQHTSSSEVRARPVEPKPSPELGEENIFFTPLEFPPLGARPGRSPTMLHAKEDITRVKLEKLGHTASSSPSTASLQSIYEFDPEASPAQLPLSRGSKVKSIYTERSIISPKSPSKNRSHKSDLQIKLEAHSTMDSSSPLSYHSSSGDEDKVNLDQHRVESRGAESHSSTVSGAEFNSDSYTNSYLGVEPNSHDPAQVTEDTAPNVQPQNVLPDDVYNMANVGAGYEEPRTPPATRPPYTLRPAYSGDDLMALQEKGLSGSFKPHHRNTLIGLKGILRTPTSTRESASQKDVLFSPMRQLCRPKPTIKDWRTAGLPYLLFAKKKKSLDQVVEESLRKEAARRRERRRRSARRERQRRRKDK